MQQQKSFTFQSSQLACLCRSMNAKVQSCFGPAWWKTAARSCTHAKTQSGQWPWYAEVHFTDDFSGTFNSAHAFKKTQEFLKSLEKGNWLGTAKDAIESQHSYFWHGRLQKGWSSGRKKLPCPRHIRPVTCQPDHYEQELIQGLLSLLLSLLLRTRSKQYRISHNIYFYIYIILSTAMPNIWMKRLWVVPRLHSSLIASSSFLYYLASAYFYSSSGHKKLTRKRKHLPNRTVNLFTSWNILLKEFNASTPLLKYFPFLTHDDFLSKICPIPF